MAGKPLRDAVSAVDGFVDQLGPDARVGGVSLGGTCQVDPGPGPGQDRAPTRTFFAGAVAGGDTPLYDAILTAIQQSLAVPEGRRMVIVLTDGEDTCSKVTFNTVVDAAVHNGVPLTLVGLGPDIQPDVLGKLADLTGGEYVAVEDSDKLQRAYADLAARLSTQYQLSYQSAQLADRQEHTLAIRVRSGTTDASGQSQFTPPVIEPAVHVSVDPGQQIAEPLPLQVTSTSPVQLTRADLFLDDTLLESVAAPPLTYTLDPAGLRPGKHVVRVHAWDSAGSDAETSVTVEFIQTGLFGRVPFWVVLGIALALPVLVLVGALTVGGQRRLRCPNCGRNLKATWTTCPYCVESRGTRRAHA